MPAGIGVREAFKIFAWLRKTFNAESEITIYLNPAYDAGNPATHTIPMVLCRIPGGSFSMGSPDTERNRMDYEGPLHSVTIDYDFYMGKYEVTQQQWLAVQGSWPETNPSSAYGVGDQYPAYYISWNDAKSFITSLNTHISNTNQGPLTLYLPSESEWEYATRAGTQTRFY